MPSVRPFNENDPAQAFLLSMVEKANDNIKTYDGTMEPIEKIIDSAQVVLAIWSDLTKPHGVGFLVIKGEDILKVSQAYGVAVQATPMPSRAKTTSTRSRPNKYWPGKRLYQRL
jgi:hypothetical protein